MNRVCDVNIVQLLDNMYDYGGVRIVGLLHDGGSNYRWTIITSAPNVETALQNFNRWAETREVPVGRELRVKRALLICTASQTFRNLHYTESVTGTWR